MQHVTKEKGNSARNNRVWRYSKYALGEIILIVIGVLLAVSIDNWNTNRLKTKQLDEIIGIVKKDFNQDQKSLTTIREHYGLRKPLFDSIINQQFNVTAISRCKECHFLISGHLLFRPNIDGFSSLKRYVQEDDIEDRSLLAFMQHYSTLLDELELLKTNIVEDVNGNLTQWRDSYPWFTAFFQGKNDLTYHKYQAQSPEYRNKVAYHYALVYDNYLPVLEEFTRIQKRFSER